MTLAGLPPKKCLVIYSLFICYLSEQQVFQFDLRMAVLTIFAYLLTVRADGLLRTSMNARETHGTMVAGESFVVRQADVLHRTNSYARTATVTLVRNHFRAQTMNHASLYCLAAEEP